MTRLSPLFLPTLAALILHSAQAIECSLCGDNQFVHDDHQQILLYVSQSEMYTACTDLAIATMERLSGTDECSRLQDAFASNCCAESTDRRRAQFAPPSTWTNPAPAPALWVTKPAPTPINWAAKPTGAAASVSSWNFFNRAPSKPTVAKPITYTPFWPKPQTQHTRPSWPSANYVSVVKPTTGWWNQPSNQHQQHQNYSPVHVLPSINKPPPVLQQAPPSNVAHSRNPAWGHNNGATAKPGETYANDGYCGICLEPSNPSLGIVVNSFGVSDFSFTGACRDINAAFRNMNIKSDHQMCNVTLARFRGDCGCGGFENNAANFFGHAPQAPIKGSWCIKGSTC